MYACLQKAKCDEYHTIPSIEDYNRCAPPRAHTEVEKAQSFAFNTAAGAPTEVALLPKPLLLRVMLLIRYFPFRQGA
jgi:hypothetical protein